MYDTPVITPHMGHTSHIKPEHLLFSHVFIHGYASERGHVKHGSIESSIIVMRRLYEEKSRGTAKSAKPTKQTVVGGSDEHEDKFCQGGKRPCSRSVSCGVVTCGSYQSTPKSRSDIPDACPNPSRSEGNKSSSHPLRSPLSSMPAHSLTSPTNLNQSINKSEHTIGLVQCNILYIK